MPRNQIPQAPNAQAYGQRGDQMSAQRSMPLPQTQPTPKPGGSNGQPIDVMQMAQQFDPAITPLTAASQRPGEPVTHGLPSGPGGGPEVLGPPSARQHVADLLASMAASTNDPTLADLAAQLRARQGF